MGQPGNKDVAAAVDAFYEAGETFGAVARSGGHGIEEYRAWEKARKTAWLAQAKLITAFDEAYQARVAEYAWLVREERRIRGVARDTGGRHVLIPAWRTAWLERAAGYAGHAVGDLDVNLVDAPALPKGTDRPQHLDLPEVPPYESALREAAGNATR